SPRLTLPAKTCRRCWTLRRATAWRSSGSQCAPQRIGKARSPVSKPRSLRTSRSRACAARHATKLSSRLTKIPRGCLNWKESNCFQQAMRRTRVCIYGGTYLEGMMAEFISELAYQVLDSMSAVIVCGGFKHSNEKPNAVSTDVAALRGAERYAKE